MIQDNQPSASGVGSTALIPAQAVYNITVSGNTYSGTTSTLIPGVTDFPNSSAISFSRSGTLVVYPTIDGTNVSGNGVNGRDILINTGNIGLGGAGVLNFTTNIALNLLNGGGVTQGSSLDVASVSTNTTAGTIHIDVDPGSIYLAALNLLYRTNSNFSSPFQLIRGTIDLQFSNGGASISGKLTLFGQITGGFTLGTAAVAATFTGTRR